MSTLVHESDLCYPSTMMQVGRYPIPAQETRIEYPVSDSLFIATVAHVPTVDEAERFLACIREEFADATHNCFAYRVGYGPSAAERMSDDGEPSGTAGRPIISILKGQDLGDVAVVVTRYFGGTKLGTGGLVRAYSGATRAVLAELPRKERVERIHRKLITDYSRYEPIKQFIVEREGDIEDEQFAAEVTIRFTLPVDRTELFDQELVDFTHGQLTAIDVD